MNSKKIIKIATLSVWAVFLILWLMIDTQSKVSSFGGRNQADESPVIMSGDQDDYLGSETCKACHEEQFDSFSTTKHAKLSQVDSWKDKVQGCESCHGPGAAHVEGGGDKTKIISFKDKSAKQISETCLTCHSSSEEHSSFRRSDHLRNNVGCTDCHTAHGADKHATQIGSASNPAIDSDYKPGTGTLAMLKVSEPQLCMSCHTSTRAQFSQPFHHKVMEGQMNCSDCHNAHGTFELKNARLSVGADVACVKCHTEKQGPFVYEHLPITVEGCATCHNTHGSSNPKMLKRNQVRQLCLECHSAIFDNLAPNAPGFHNISTSRFADCTTCHVKIHGSNTNHVFFR